MRFASLKSPNPAVRARLQAALFTNRKRNKERREVVAPPSSWGEGSITVAYDSENDGYGFNSYNGTGAIVSPNPSFPILSFLVYPGFDFISLEVSGGVVSELSGATITIKGQTFSIPPLSDLSGVTGGNIPVTTDFLSAADVGNIIPFIINLA